VKICDFAELELRNHSLFLKQNWAYLSSTRKESKATITSLKPFIYHEEIPFEQSVLERIQERVGIFSSSDNPVEWGCVPIGKPKVLKDEAIVPVTDFVELPLWNLSRSKGLSILLDDILKISKRKFVVGLLHSHPNDDLMPSSSDLATFLYTDVLLGRPLIYMIVSPNKQRKPLILHFRACHECPNSFFKILKNLKKERG